MTCSRHNIAGVDCLTKIERVQMLWFFYITIWYDTRCHVKRLIYIQLQKLLEIVHFNYLVYTLEKGIWLSLFHSLCIHFLRYRQWTICILYTVVWFCNLLENVIQIKSKENIYRHFHWNIFFSVFIVVYFLVCLFDCLIYLCFTNMWIFTLVYYHLFFQRAQNGDESCFIYLICFSFALILFQIKKKISPTISSLFLYKLNK